MNFFQVILQVNTLLLLKFVCDNLFDVLKASKNTQVVLIYKKLEHNTDMFMYV